MIEGDVGQPGLGLAPEISESLRKNLDLIVNSAGLVDFNPDLRDALATNVEGAVNLVDFIRQSDHAALMHISTCYVVGARDGRITEHLQPNYTPIGDQITSAPKPSGAGFVKRLMRLIQGQTLRAGDGGVAPARDEERFRRREAIRYRSRESNSQASHSDG